MPRTLTLLALAMVLGATACGGPKPEAGKPGGKGGEFAHNVFSNSVFGSSRVVVTPDLCAGRTVLQQGSATVKDTCFSGDTNVVLCTNVSAINPVRCTPHRGSLAIFGSGSDEISYARVK